MNDQVDPVKRRRTADFMTYSLCPIAQRAIAPERLYTVDEMRASPGAVPRAAGVYSWWFRTVLPGVPMKGTLVRGRLRLLYVGIAPRAPSKGKKRVRALKGKKRVRTLRERLLNHCRGPIASSTLRRTLACLLAADLGFQFFRRSSGKIGMSASDEDKLTRWMDDNGRVGWIECPEPWEIEQALIASGPHLPLNIQGSRNSFAIHLRALRASVKRARPRGGRHRRAPACRINNPRGRARR
jgi:hypothetical protein